jgi:PhnB protein
MNRSNDNPNLQTYLNFEGRCEEALEFYKRAIGAEVTRLFRFKESPEPPDPSLMGPDFENKILHAVFRVGPTTVMASDGRCAGQGAFQGFSLSLTARSDAEMDRLFNALAEGGQVQMPAAKTFFSSRFGMVKDRFGVSWMVLVTPE